MLSAPTTQALCFFGAGAFAVTLVLAVTVSSASPRSGSPSPPEPQPARNGSRLKFCDLYYSHSLKDGK